jgi:hypothetical protein
MSGCDPGDNIGVELVIEAKDVCLEDVVGELVMKYAESTMLAPGIRLTSTVLVVVVVVVLLLSLTGYGR